MTMRPATLFTAEVGPRVDWRDLRGGISTGDIMLCQSIGAIGLVQQLPTGAPYTHVAMFIRTVDGGLYILESAMAKENVDVITGKTDGPKLVEANHYIGMYLGHNSGMLTYRPLRMCRTHAPMALSAERVEVATRMLARMLRPSVKYERRVFDLANAFLRIYSDNVSDPSSVFCSELVAAMMITFGLELSRPADKYIPRDFSQAFEDLFSVRSNVGASAAYLGAECTIVLSGPRIKRSSLK